MQNICTSVRSNLAAFTSNLAHALSAFIHKGKFLREVRVEAKFADTRRQLLTLCSTNHSGRTPLLYLSYGSRCCSLPFILAPRSQSRAGQETLRSLNGKGPSSFLTKAAQALVTGHYQKARPYSVEATMLYALCRFFQKDESDTEPWLLLGIAARLALRMGYHRDPRHLAYISPFEGEMRRRTFSAISTFELLVSFQKGLPAIIHEQYCDTEHPGNLFDEDFDESSKTIPPSRPSTDPTPMLYYCYKGRLARIFRKIARQALSPSLPSHQDVMQLDDELLKIHSEIPPTLAWKPLSSSVTDETYAIMHRLNLELVYQKSMMILHRVYLSHERSNSAFAYSRNACINASMQVLQYQAEAHQATQPGGQLHNDQWATSNLTLHDFLLAGMITCLDLYESHRQVSVGALSASDLESQREKYDVLRTSQEIWQSRRTMSKDEKRASNVLAVMLSKIPRPAAQTYHAPNGEPLTDIAQPLSQISFDDTNTAAAYGRAPMNEPLSTMPSLYGEYATVQDDNSSQEVLDAIFADSDMLDWVSCCSYLSGHFGLLIKNNRTSWISTFMKERRH